MLKRRICYLLLLGEGCYLIMLYNYRGLRFMLCCLIFIPLICLLLLIPAAFSCKVDFDMAQQLMIRGETSDFVLTVSNKGLLPVSGVFVCVSFKAPGVKAVRAKRRLQGLGRKGKARLSFELSSEHSGRAQLKLTRIYVCDYLGLFSIPLSFSKKKKLHKEISIFPRIMPISEQEAACISWCRLGAGEREGDMLLRSYQEGDSLHRVYWKLSARTQELQIRDFEQSGSVVLFLDFDPERKTEAGQWDAYLDRAYSLLFFLAQEGAVSHRLVEVAWRQKGSILKKELADEGVLQAWMEALLLGRPQGSVVGEDMLFGESLVFRLKEDRGLYYGEQCI